MDKWIEGRHPERAFTSTCGFAALLQHGITPLRPLFCAKVVRFRCPAGAAVQKKPRHCRV